MKNLKVKEILRKVIVVAFAGVIIVSVVACGKPEEGVSVEQPTLMTEAASENREVEQPDLIVDGADTQAAPAEEFTWKEVDADDTLRVTTADIELKAEPRDESDTIATIPKEEYFSYDALCVSDDESETDLGYAKLIYNEEAKTGYIKTDENIEVVTNDDGSEVKRDEVPSEFGQTVYETNEAGEDMYGGKTWEEFISGYGLNPADFSKEQPEQGIAHEPTAEEIAEGNSLARELGVTIE